MILALEFILRFRKPLAIVAMAATLFGFFVTGYHRGHRAAAAQWQAMYAADIAAANAATVQALNKARDAEQQAAKQVAEIEGKLHEQQVKANNDQERLLADVRSGAVGLRQRLTCPPSKPSPMPGAASSASSSDAAEKRGLQPADADFLIRLAGRADEVTRQLVSCQSILSAERQ